MAATQPVVADTRRSRRRRCRALLSNRSRQCKRWAMAGQEVCQVHGGAAPQARRSARSRLDEAADPAAAALIRSMEFALEKGALLHPTLVKTACAILDRAGFPRASRVELEQVQAKLTDEYVAAFVAVVRRSCELVGLDLRADQVRAAVAQAVREHSARQRGEEPPTPPQPANPPRPAPATAPPVAEAPAATPGDDGEHLRPATSPAETPEAEPEPEPEEMVL